jgi:hypothetical protein
MSKIKELEHKGGKVSLDIIIHLAQKPLIGLFGPIISYEKTESL